MRKTIKRIINIVWKGNNQFNYCHNIIYRKLSILDKIKKFRNLLILLIKEYKNNWTVGNLKNNCRNYNAINNLAVQFDYQSFKEKLSKFLYPIEIINKFLFQITKL